MTTYNYKVNGMTWTDTEAFGTAWKAAKAEAEKHNAPIYRKVIVHEEREEVLCNGGIFLKADGIEADRIKVFWD